MGEPALVFRFGPYEVKTNAREIYKHGTRLKLRGQPYQILETLLERPGQVITRDEIRQKLWPADTFVDFEHGLNTSIKKLRQTLCDSATEPRYIETLPRVGYRFIASVETEIAKIEPTRATVSPAAESLASAPLADMAEQDQEQDKKIHRATAAGSPRFSTWKVAVPAFVLVVLAVFFIFFRQREVDTPVSRLLRGTFGATPKTYDSVAVLPLQSLSSDPNQDYFADGITDELITNLAQFGNLRVISRTSIMHYKGVSKTAPQIGKELNVDALVEGTIERVGNGVRVRVQLIESASDRHLWARVYDRELKDVLMLESSVAHDIAEEVQGRILLEQSATSTGQNRPVNPDAYEAYLKGRYFWNRRSPEALNKSIEYFQQATKLDPNLAVAYAGLADTYSILGSDVLPADIAQGRAREAANKAIQLDPSLAEGHAALALVRFYYDWDWPGAEKEFQRALELNPNYAIAHQWYSYFLDAGGRLPEAIREVKRAQELDPLSLAITTSLASRYESAGRFAEAITLNRSTLEMDPSFAPAHLSLGMVYQEQQEWAQAIEEFKTAVKLSPDSSMPLAMLACAFAKSGKRTEAEHILKGLQQPSTDKDKYVSSFEIAKIFAALDDRENAFRWLERSYQQHESQLAFLNVTKTLMPLHDDQRFRELSRRMKLPNAS
jgi:TolB-like protein/DNA-binding winged helix-turn-helix (wHTH) protein/Flp pilus assembly protein TadD